MSTKPKISPTSGIALLHKGGVKRILGIWDLFAIGYGDLGASIYYALGVTALFALGATPIALAIAGIVFVCTALSYAELASIYHESGGSASYVRHAFNDIASFIAGWGLLLDYVVTIAISAFAVSPYLSVLFPKFREELWGIGLSCIVIVFLYGLNVIGIKRSTRTSLVLAILAICTQIAIVGMGFVTELDLSKVVGQMRIGAGTTWSPDWSQFIQGVAMAMVAYTGIESIAQLGSESVKPSKNLPRAIFLNIVALLFLYFGISVIGLSVVSPQELGTVYVNNPIAAIANSLPYVGSWMLSWVGVLGAILLFVSTNAGLIGSSRLAYNMGEHYQLPRFFSHIHLKFRTPYLSLLVFSCLAICLIIISRGKLEFLADLYNFGAMVAFFSTNLALIVLRIKKPDQPRPFAIPCNLPFFKSKIPLSACIGCCATFAVWLLIVMTKPAGRFLGLAWMAVGLGLFLVYRRKKGLSAKSIEIEKIKIPDLEEIKIKRILVSVQSPRDTETIQLACEVAKRHKSSVLFAHIIEVPFTISVDATLPARTAQGDLLLKQAEAIARDLNVPIETLVMRGRRFDDVLLSTLTDKNIDLVVAGWKGKVSSDFVNRCPCRVWLFRD